MARFYYNKPMKKDKNTLILFAGIVVLWLLLFGYFWDLANSYFEWAIRLSGEV